MDRSKLLKEFKFKQEEVAEDLPEQFIKTGFPNPLKAYHLVWEVHDLSLEEPYFWVLDVLKDAFPIVEKLEDSFAAAENSAFFGATQVKLGGQQDKVSQFLATSGKMIKELFQMVRELRIIDERLQYYNDAEKEESKPVSERKKSAEITLKGIFVDLVQGGGKSPASVYGMAQQLEFVTLPDLFFDTPPFKDSDELERHIKNLEENFNRNLLRVLQRHLRQFLEWKKRTHKEHDNRKTFMLKYLLQHFEIIKMYITWVKPYLKHVSKLTLKEKNMDSADMVSAFEGSMLDIEVLFRKKEVVNHEEINGCILATFGYRTRPEMKVVQEGYHRGPVHIGKFEMKLRSYLWTKEQVEQYKDLKEKETLLYMGEISSSIQDAMTSLGDELGRYLTEAREEAGAKEEKKEGKKETVKKKTMAEKFLGDFYTPKQKKEKLVKISKKDLEKLKEKSGELKGHVLFHSWLTYHNFKKAHGMVAW